MNCTFNTNAETDSEARRTLRLQRATRILARRGARRKFFSPAIFGEPAWELLLKLYLAEEEGGKLTITNLCQNSGFPTTTALRWLHYLEADRLVRREASLVDNRIYYVHLNVKARMALHQFLLEAWPD